MLLPMMTVLMMPVLRTWVAVIPTKEEDVMMVQTLKIVFMLILEIRGLTSVQELRN